MKHTTIKLSTFDNSSLAEYGISTEIIDYLEHVLMHEFNIFPPKMHKHNQNYSYECVNVVLDQNAIVLISSIQESKLLLQQADDINDKKASSFYLGKLKDLFALFVLKLKPALQQIKKANPKPKIPYPTSHPIY